MDWEGGVAQPGARPGMDRHHGPGNTARARAVWLPGRRRPLLGRADDRGCQRSLPGHGHDALPRGMQLIVDLAAVFAERRQRGLLAMEAACFGSDDAAEVWAALVSLISSTTGRHPTGLRHYSVSIGAVAGVVLEDGACVAVKVFASWHDPTFLDAARAT